MDKLEERLTLWYDELKGENFPLVGKKNANLGEMLKAGIPISPGFAITIHGNDLFMEESGIKAELEKLIAGKYRESTPENIDALSRFAMRAIEEAGLPAVLEDQILADYHTLCDRCGVADLPVAVRSSGAVSMPGQMETYLNIRGDRDLIDYVRKCWASSYCVEALTYRINREIGVLFNIGVGIPKMVNSRVSGVIFTINPLNGDPSKISIDASYGLGEAVVSGLVTPDTYLVDKITLDLVKLNRGSKESECDYKPNSSDIIEKEVDEARRKANALTPEELKHLCVVSKKIEKYYGKAYDIEFGIDADLKFPENIIILQVRPESVWNKKKDEEKKVSEPTDAMNMILKQLMTGVRFS
jgi:pyruvate,water dikinase